MSRLPRTQDKTRASGRTWLRRWPSAQPRDDLTTSRSYRFAIAALIVLTTAACSSSGSAKAHASHPPADARATGSTPVTSGSAPAAETPSRTPTLTPTLSTSAEVAVNAYRSYQRAFVAAEQSPNSTKYLKDLADITIDPQQGRDGQSLLDYSVNKTAWRGPPPVPRIQAVSTQLNATPWPTATIQDCPTYSADWRPYLIANNKSIPVTYPKGSARPPFTITATIIEYKSRWVVQTVTTSMRKSCAPQSP